MTKTIEKKKRVRLKRNFPAVPFQEAVKFAKSIFDIGAGQAVKRLTLFDHLGKSPESGTSRALITNSNKYGLTKGSAASEDIELTPLGNQVTSDRSSEKDRTAASIQPAILDIAPFNSVFEGLVRNKLPTSAVLGDRLCELDVAQEVVDEAVDTFILNLRDVGLLRTWQALNG